MTIRRKLLLTFALILAFVLSLGIIYYRSLVTIRNRLTVVENMDDLGVSISDMRRGEKNYLLFKDNISSSDWIRQVALTRKAIESKREELTLMEGKDYCEGLIKDFSDYETLANRIVSTTSYEIDADKVRSQGQKLDNYWRGIIHAERTRIETMISSSFHIFLFTLLITIIAGLTSVFIIMRNIVKPLARIEKATHRISEGNYVAIDGIISRDEMGNLQKAFNIMVRQIQQHQEELVQAGKLASLGTLTSGVAHELNNPINNISMIAQTFTRHYNSLSDQERLEYVNRIDGQCERTREIIDNLLDFSRIQPRTFAFADVGQVIRESIKLVENQLVVSKIKCELKLSDNLPQVRISANRIKQVIINIFTNAIKAMSGGGVLTIQTSANDNDNFISIDISDTGIGIPPTVLPHIFDPFFTTNVAGQGAGLGLSVSYGILKRHGGIISVQSKVGEGSTFTIKLPAAKNK